MAVIAAFCALALAVFAPQLPLTPVPAAQTFEQWLAAFREEAAARGISQRTIDSALDGLNPLPVVVERDRSQAELVLTLEQYLDLRLTKPMLRTARRMRTAHRRLLSRVSARYGVPPSIIVAVWGLESNFGRFSGVRPTIATLATLAYDPRRASMFREELFDALEILDSGDVDVRRMRGSWAGAIGQPQFMPSSFLQYAQDFDKDGRRDIWSSLPDVFASIANYLKQHGWERTQTWGREVRVPPALLDRLDVVAPLQKDGCVANRQMTISLPLKQWRALGLKTTAGHAIPVAKFDASLIRAGSRSFLVYPNYRAILAYNCVNAYGLSVGLLADHVQ